jgi:hypothetical protein
MVLLGIFLKSVGYQSNLDGDSRALFRKMNIEFNEKDVEYEF